MKKSSKASPPPRRDFKDSPATPSRSDPGYEYDFEEIMRDKLAHIPGHKPSEVDVAREAEERDRQAEQHGSPHHGSKKAKKEPGESGFDMFAEHIDIEEAIRKANAAAGGGFAGAAKENPNLTDNWDDNEGYYRKQI